MEIDCLVFNYLFHLVFCSDLDCSVADFYKKPLKLNKRIDKKVKSNKLKMRKNSK